MNHLFLDVDGVVADFDRGCKEFLGMENPRKYESNHGSKIFWKKLYSVPDFFYRLEPMPDAYQLYKAVEHLKPTFLTGLPNCPDGEEQKLRWRDKHFPGVPMIVCKSREKFMHMKHRGDILVDDWTKYQHIWEENGGIFVRHFHATHTVERLQYLRPDWF